MPEITETEQKILDAAAEIFLEKGMDGARMQDIADKAGINKAGLHYYFRSKDKLYEQVVLSKVGPFLQKIVQTFSKEMGIKEFLSIFIDNYIDNFSQHPQIGMFVIWEIRQGGENFFRLFLENFKGPVNEENIIIKKIRQAIQNNEIRPLDPVHLALNIIGMCIYPFIAAPVIEKIFQGVKINNKEFIEGRKREIKDLIWEGIRVTESGIRCQVSGVSGGCSEEKQK